MNTNSVYLLLIISIVITACSPSNNKNVNEQFDKAIEIDENLVKDLNKAKQVFYALPSPIETAMLIKRAGTTFNEKLLNPVNKNEQYTITRDRALNFGVYGADLSYSSLFSQTQITIQYMAVSKTLADRLGILDFLQADFVERLEKNVNNRDSSMAIITEGFMNSNTYLQESGRPEIAALIITGGWIEGLYIATSLAKESPSNSELIDRIIDQKLSMATLISLLTDYKANSDIDYTLSLVNHIREVYDQVQIVTSKVEPITNQNQKVTTLQAKTEIFMSDEVFKDLCFKVDSIRNVITGI